MASMTTMPLRALATAGLLLAPLAPPALADVPPDEAEIAAQEAAASARLDRMALHQGMGLATLGGLAATAGLGLAVATLPPGWEYVHVGFAAATTGLYLTTAGLALTAPPSPFAREPIGWSSVAVHKNLAWLHAAGMASTVGLGLATLLIDPRYADLHGIAAFTTLGLVGVSAGVIAFGN
jgi:hypothetical protein